MPGFGRQSLDMPYFGLKSLDMPKFCRESLDMSLEPRTGKKTKGASLLSCSRRNHVDAKLGIMEIQDDAYDVVEAFGKHLVCIHLKMNINYLQSF